MKVVAEFVGDERYVIKEPSYDIHLCTITFTDEMVKRLRHYGCDDTQLMADEIAGKVEQVFYNLKYRPTATSLCVCGPGGCQCSRA